jgi:hypothetical protein
MSDVQDEVQNIAAAEAELHHSRGELRRLLVVDRKVPKRGEFRPRSKTMQFLTGNGAVALLAVGAGGILLSRPQLALRLFRVVPIGAVVRALALRYMTRGK